jgi:dolichol-phosphate mannosyltransferase
MSVPRLDQLPGVTVLLPTLREAENVDVLIPQLRTALEPLAETLEILVVDTPTDDGTVEVASRHGARYIEVGRGYANAMRTGFAAATQPFVVTMDADCSHDPAYIPFMLRQVRTCDLVIASRYVEHGGQDTTLFRYFTSRVLNWWLQLVSSMPLQDLSGGFKVYRREVLDEIEVEAENFEIQAELNIKAFGHGFRIREVGFVYHPRAEGESKAAIIRYGLTFLKTSLRLRRWRNSRDFCDYDERAYNSRIPMQRAWQRRRAEAMVRMLPPDGACLDVGCGSGRLIVGYPRVIGIDLSQITLRYLARHPRRLAAADARALPFVGASFDAVYCCEVIEHVAEADTVLLEIARVLRPGGRALVSTPDYGSAAWPLIEKLYNSFVASARGHEHPTRFDRAKLEAAGADAGLTVVRSERVNASIVMTLFEKPEI